MINFTAKLVRNDGEVVDSYNFDSKDLKNAKTVAWHKWNMNYIEGKTVEIHSDNIYLTRKLRQSTWQKGDVK